MRLVLTFLVWVAVLLVGAVTATAAFRYGWQAGHGHERYIYAIGGLVLDVTKTLLPLLLGLFLAGRSGAGTIFRAVVGWSFWLGLVALSLYCAFGLYAISRDAAAGDTLGTQALYKQLTSDKGKHEADLIALRAVRTVEAVDGELEPMKRNRLWDRTVQCTAATAGESRDYCGKVDKLTAERRSARPAADVQADIKSVEMDLRQIETKLSGMDMTTVMKKADPATEAMSALTGYSADTVKNTFAGMIALLFEMTGLLPWIITGSHGHKRRDEEVEPVEMPAKASKKPAKATLDPVPAEDAPAEADSASAPQIELPEVDSIPAQWMKATLVKRKGSYVPADEMHEQFTQWCRVNGHEVVSKNRFGRMMTALEFTATTKGGERRYYDLALIPKAGAPVLRVVGGN